MATQYVFYPNSSTSVTAGDVTFKLNGADQIVTKDTGTPANNRPLPVELLNTSGGTNTVTANQGTAALVASSWPIKITDGTDTALVSAGGELSVVMATAPLPTGAATAANQVTGNNSLASIDGKIVAVNTGAVVVSSSALPTGAATEATLSSLNGKVVAVDTGAVVVSSSALPTGAATSALQTTGNTSLSSIDGKMNSLGQKLMATSMPVTIAQDQTPTIIYNAENLVNDYGTSPVTTAAYVTLIASVASRINYVDIFDSSGQIMAIAEGGVGSEVVKFYVYPGGNGWFPITFPAGARISIKAITANATTGYLVFNCFA